MYRRILAAYRAWRGGAAPLSNFWGPQDCVSQREALAARWLRGQGVEIGGLHVPVKVPPGASVKYVDYKTREENRKRYPELGDQPLVNTDIVDDGFILNAVPPASVDFLIANHALEHSPDPYGTLLIWASKLGPEGVLFMAVPIADRCYDKGRPITPLHHLLEDHQRFRAADVPALIRVAREHLTEFMTISGQNILKMDKLPLRDPRSIPASVDALMAPLEQAIREAASAAEGGEVTGVRPPLPPSYGALISAHVYKLNKAYDVHYHTFSPRSYHDFLTHFARNEGMRVADFRKSGGGECIGIVQKLAGG